MCGRMGFMSHNPLTHREQQILCLVAKGYREREIAATLFIGDHTIRNALYQARNKLCAGNNTHAVLIALERGWIVL
jgi:DNA-binding NarL/FixJ family response regulator